MLSKVQLPTLNGLGVVVLKIFCKKLAFRNHETYLIKDTFFLQVHPLIPNTPKAQERKRVFVAGVISVIGESSSTLQPLNHIVQRKELFLLWSWWPSLSTGSLDFSFIWILSSCTKGRFPKM